MSHNNESSRREVPAFDGCVPPPKFAAIETTMFCNLECHFCIQYQDGTTVRGPHMDPETFEIVSGALFPHIETFQLSVSGEPLMSKGLDRVLQKAAEHGLRAEYYSNGTLLNDRMVDLILPTLAELNISFDGATKETFEKLRRGARWDTVLANVKRVVAAAARLPDEERPTIGFACTLMEQNVRELPDLVDLAADLGLDFVRAAHVLPGIAEVQGQSLWHHRELAEQCIEAACRRAADRGVPFSVQPLDNLISSLAESDDMGSPHFREGGRSDGVALPGRAVNTDRVRARPSSNNDRSSSKPDTGRSDAPVPESIWTCQFLWERIYVGHDGNTLPCCVPGVPGLGNLKTASLDDLWNGPVSRAMRLGLVTKDPAHCCKGCQHIAEVTDPTEIRRLLAGRSAPTQPPSLPPILRPVTGSAQVGPELRPEMHDATPPTLAWSARDEREGYECAGYEVQMSLDGFRTLLFTTLWHDIPIAEPRFEIPPWAWALAPREQPISWRALAFLPQERRLVGTGCIAKA